LQELIALHFVRRRRSCRARMARLRHLRVRPVRDCRTGPACLLTSAA
jgi:hypothetical protein